MLLESDGYEPDAWLLRQTMRGVLRNARDGYRGFLYPAAGPANAGAQAGRWAGEVWNIPAKVSKMGLSGFAAGAANALAFAFDTCMFKIAIRDDIKMKVFTEGAISDARRRDHPQPDAAGREGLAGHLPPGLGRRPTR